MVEFIQVGSTSREDVLLRLGIPDSSGSSWLTYLIEEYSWGYFGAVGYYVGIGDTEISKKTRAVVIEFDPESIVTACRLESVRRSWETLGRLGESVKADTHPPHNCGRQRARTSQ